MKTSIHPFLLIICFLESAPINGQEKHDFPSAAANVFFEKHCLECHDDLTQKGGLDLLSLSTDLSQEATLEKWVRIYDRIAKGEMPPRDQPHPTEGEKRIFRDEVAPPLASAHEATKGTVLRRLNKKEYQNSLSDLLGVTLHVLDDFPEDGRAGEFDTVGSALGISQSQMQEYLKAAETAIDLAIADTTSAPKPRLVQASYATGRDKTFIGKQWLLAEDGAVVFFRETGYPGGKLREANTREAGHYRVKVTGYAYQSEVPVTFRVGAESFARGSGKPTFGYFAFPPGEPTSIEFTTWIDKNYMVSIVPQGIFDPENLIREKGIKNYPGPGLAISEIELEGPLLDEFPTRGHKLIFSNLDRREIEPRNPRDKEKSYYKPRFEIRSDQPAVDVTAVLIDFASAAYRRPATEEDIAPYLILFQQEMKQGEDFERALRTSLIGILCSPPFLYLIEPPGKLPDYALAARLSYFLNRSTPDLGLQMAAKSGNLSKDPKALAEQATRLMESDRFERFVIDFTDSWLDLRNIEFTNPDAKLFPEFDRFLQFSMVEETRSYFREILSENLPVDTIVKADFTMLNNRLARHYGIDGIQSPSFKKVSLPKDSPRGGFLSHASIHKVSANGTNTSPVLRGVWINERILGKHPAPPPPGIPGVEPDIRGAETLRELLTKHRDSESCQSCHELIDPPGFALESFSPVGTWRETFRSLNNEQPKPDAKLVEGRRVSYRIGPPVDDSGILPDGTPFSGFHEYRDLIAEDRRTLAKAFVGKLLVFATGREMGFSDRPEINSIVDQAESSGYRLRDLLFFSISSEIFRQK